MPDAQKTPASDKPSPQSKRDYVDTILKKLIADYQGKRQMARFASYCIRAGLIGLGGITTILLGLREFAALASLDQAIGVTTLILSALVTMITAWEGFSNSGWRWAHYRMMLSKLYLLQDDLNFATLGASPEDQDKATDACFQAFRDLLTEANRAWEEQRFPNIKGGS